MAKDEEIGELRQEIAILKDQLDAATTQSVLSGSAHCDYQDDEDDRSVVSKFFGRPRSSNRSIFSSDMSIHEDKPHNLQALMQKSIWS